MATNNNQQPQTWTCVKCGAALPAETGTSELVTCSHCGTPFKLPTAMTRHGGVSISGGSVTIGGDVVDGDKIVMAASDRIQPAQTTWDKPATLEDEDVSIDADELQVTGNVVNGNLVKAAPPAPKLNWREKAKRLFAK